MSSNLRIDKQFILIVGGGTGDGGGWGILPSGKVKRIPDNNPGLKKLLVASRLLAQAEQMGTTAEARQIHEIASSLANKGAGEIAAK